MDFDGMLLGFHGKMIGIWLDLVGFHDISWMGYGIDGLNGIDINC
jgi:hypothetical protein